MTKLQYVLGAIALLAIGFVLGVVGTKAVPSSNLGAGGSVVYTATHFVGDLYQGQADTLIFRDGAWVAGPIATSTLFTSTGGITNSGALTQSGTASFSGASTFTGAVTATKAATLQCPVVYNGATTTTAYYMYANGGTVVTTTTKPALCP